MPHPEAGGQGGESPPPPPSRSDLRLEAQALRADWPMGPGVRTRLLRRAIRLALSEDKRIAVAALHVVESADMLNLRQQALDLRREELAFRMAEVERARAAGPMKSAAEIAAEMEASRTAFLAGREADDALAD